MPLFTASALKREMVIMIDSLTLFFVFKLLQGVERVY